MKFSAPTQPIFIISLVFAILALLGFFGILTPVASHAFWLMTIAWVVLVIGTVMKGL